jgi:hypothetical protein
VLPPNLIRGDDALAVGIENNEDNVFAHYKSTKLESLWFSLAFDGWSFADGVVGYMNEGKQK